MTVLSRLACALNRRDEVPNVQLAESVSQTSDIAAVKELVANLSNTDKNIQTDCIKVLYEVGARKPKLVADYFLSFGKLLESRNNRLVWGAMAALDSIALVESKGVYGLLKKVLDAADTGSVITRDHAVKILCKLGTQKQYEDECVPILIKQLAISPNNQFPMYAELALQIASEKYKKKLQNVMTDRLEGLEKASQKKRVEKVLLRLERQ